MISANITLTNGKTVEEAQKAARNKIEKIYKDSWEKGVSVPFFDEKGNTYLANPDGSEDMVCLNQTTRTYNIIKRIAEPGQGRHYFLINKW